MHKRSVKPERRLSQEKKCISLACVHVQKALSKPSLSLAVSYEPVAFALML